MRISRFFMIDFFSVKFFLRLMFFFLFGYSFLFSQEEDSIRESVPVNFQSHRYSFRVDFAVPNPVNAAWRKSMVGVYEGNLTMNNHLPTGLFFGAGYKRNLFYTPPKFFIFDLKTKMQMDAGYAQLGFDFHRKPGFFISPILRGGWSFTSFSGVQCKSNPSTEVKPYQSAFAEAVLQFNFLPDPDFGVTFFASYAWVNQVWNPEYICLQDHISFDGINKSAMSSYLNLGLGIYFGVGKLKKN